MVMANMKRIFILISCAAILFACKKEKFNKNFSGRWEYVTFVGYPFNFPSYPPGNGKIIEIGENGSFKRYAHDTLLFKGRYNIVEKRGCQGNQKLLYFKTNDPSFNNNNSIEMQGDSLFFSSPACLADGGSSIYKKLPF